MQAAGVLAAQICCGLLPDRISLAARQSTQDFPRPPTSSLHFNDAWEATASEGAEWTRAVCVFQHMSQLLISPDVTNGNIAISSCEKLAAWVEGLVLLQHMRQAGTKTNEITFNSAISTCSPSLSWHVRISTAEAMELRKLATCTGYVDEYGRSANSRSDWFQRMPQHICSSWTLGTQFAASQHNVMLPVCPGDSPVYDEFVRLDTICSDLDHLLASKHDGAARMFSHGAPSSAPAEMSGMLPSMLWMMQD